MQKPSQANDKFDFWDGNGAPYRSSFPLWPLALEDRLTQTRGQSLRPAAPVFHEPLGPDLAQLTPRIGRARVVQILQNDLY
jgi:hypothetical protein